MLSHLMAAIDRQMRDKYGIAPQDARDLRKDLVSLEQLKVKEILHGKVA